MKQRRNQSLMLLILCVLCLCAANTAAQNRQNKQANNNAPNARADREEYSGNAISFNGPRLATSFFNLTITGKTSDEDARRYLAILDDKGQDDALNAIRSNDLGSLTFPGSVRRQLNVVRESSANGQKRIFIVFERWTQFAEERFGYRSLDYPFGVIEIFIDERTGKGEGTYIPAARLRLETDKRTGAQQLEVENFATYPVRLNNVELRGGNNGKRR